MFFCDTEGLHSINDQLKELISGILTLSQICTFSIIMINSVPSVDDLSHLTADNQFSKIFKQINKDLQSPLVGMYISGYQIEIVNILINEIYNYPDFLDTCKNIERKNEIINILITK